MVDMTKEMNRRDFLKTAATSVAGAVLAACGGASRIIPEPTIQPSIPSSPELTITPQFPTPTRVEPSPTIPPTEVPKLVTGGAGEAYSAEQMGLITTGAFKDQEDNLTQWVEGYWGNAKTNRPFLPGSGGLHTKYIFSKKDPTKAGVLIEAEGEYMGRTFTTPIDTINGGFRQYPSVPNEQYDIGVGWGPLELSGEEGTILGYEDGGWVRLNPQTNEIVATLDLKTAQWDEVDVTPQIPQGVGEIVAVEKYDGVWYGIDPLGRAMLVRNETGEWVNYERPVYGLEKQPDGNYGSYVIADAYSGVPGIRDSVGSRTPVTVPAEMLTTLPQEKISRLKKGGDDLPWGIVEEMHPLKDRPNYINMFVSGYVAGTVPWPEVGGRKIPQFDSFLVVVIPQKYADQAILVSMNNSTMPANLCPVPDASLDVNERDFNYMSKIDLNVRLKDPRMIDQQIVFAFQMRYEDWPDPERTFYKQFDVRAEGLVAAIKSGQNYPPFCGYQLFYMWFWAPESLVK